MSETKYESSVKEVPYAQTAVFAKISDLNSIGRIKDMVAGSELPQDGKYIPSDKVEQIKKALETMTFDADSVALDTPVGNITMRIIERDEPKTVKFEAVNAPIPLNMWVQLLPHGEASCLLKVTIAAEVNFFLKAMVDKPLSGGVEKLAEVLSSLPYNE